MRWFMIMMIYECTYSATMLINKQDDECNDMEEDMSCAERR